MKGVNRRRPAKSSIPQPTPDHLSLHHQNRLNTSRDSDASFASSRPSSVGIGRPGSSAADLYTDRSYQAAAIRSINAYLSAHASNLSLRSHPVSSSKDITETLGFLLHQVEFFPVTKLEDDLFFFLKSLGCPYKLNKSTLRASNTPHNWPLYLAVIHWLVQIAMYMEELEGGTRDTVEGNSMFVYSGKSYVSYIEGDDDKVEQMDSEFMEKLEREKGILLESSQVLEETLREAEAKAEELRTGPSDREKLEQEKSVLEEDVKKFDAIIGEINQWIEEKEKAVENTQKEIVVKVEEKKRIQEENEELRKRVEEQSFNARDAERMKRELQAVERDIGEAEAARNAWEEKVWDLDAPIGHKYKEIEALAMDCNNAARRLKLGDGFQYALSANGSSPAEVMGIDYKSVIKPGLESFTDDLKKSSVEKLEELILLRQLSSELSTKIEEKRNRIAILESHIQEMEAQLNLLRKEKEAHILRCAAEAKKTMEDVEMEADNMDNLERQAAEVLEVSKVKLQEAIKQSEEEIAMYGHKLFAVVDSVARFKEQTASRISGFTSKLGKIAGDVSEIYKGSLTAQFGVNIDVHH
ncbi:hypothetical protein Tsubulata_022572 [Turnera subulata]|uniref:Kinetochore protein NDC80 n=1 Tax=Turnera subulata TaxID=218843 RepID=A0A9Q0FZA5_9ROSI|nr:hypothetical protein Tsubulata_022572 [Turnera subulata]